jgi:hypothetical protein
VLNEQCDIAGGVCNHSARPCIHGTDMK